jgi:hypothetical protein
LDTLLGEKSLMRDCVVSIREVSLEHAGKPTSG